MSIKIIILAAGKGTRMKSRLPKVLHLLGGQPVLAHVLDSVATLNPTRTAVVVGHGANEIQQRIQHSVDWVLQPEQLGTGHAVQQALPVIDNDDTAVIVYGDVPLIQPATLARLLSRVDDTTIALLTVVLDDPSGYGRIARNDVGHVIGIVEHKDATPEQRAIREINSGILAIRGQLLIELLARIDNRNSQGEYYLTDIFALAVEQGNSIEAVQPEHHWEVSGINSRMQLAELERIYQRERARELMEGGVTLRDPGRVDIRGQLRAAADVTIDVNTIFIGDNTLGENVQIGANCILINSIIGAGTVIHPNSIVEDAVIEADCSVGPFARLRPGTRLLKQAKIGNFVEIKNAEIGESSKVNHLSYVGDAEVGRNVNIGAGTITCNYDGANKHRTIMEDDVFIGSNSALVAPLRIGRGATIGAGATITRDVGPDTLAISRARQSEHLSWQRPTKKK